MTAPDMESIIAAALAAHQAQIHTDEGDQTSPPEEEYSCTCGQERGSWVACGADWEWPDWTKDHAAHQARAVLDAISEAGQVEWAIFRKTADENALPFDWSAGKTYGQSMSRIERMYPRDRDQLQPRSRITGPWTAVEG